MNSTHKILLTLFVVTSIHPSLAPATTIDPEAEGGIVPQVGRWDGLTSQGLPVSFYVTFGGSVFEPDAYAVDFECPTSGPQLWGFAFALIEELIVDGRFEFTQYVDPPRQITPGARNTSRWTGRFTSPTKCSGTLDNAISVFTGDRVGTETCPVPGVSWTASWVGLASREELEAVRARESDTIGPLWGSTPWEETRTGSIRGMTSEPGGASADADESRARAVPRDGYWLGRSSQGLLVEFSVADAGSTFLPEEFDVFIDCPSSPFQSWGFGYTLLEAPIESGRFEFLFNMDSSDRITSGRFFANRWRGEFITETECVGTMDAALSVFSGERLDSEACLEMGLTWRARWRGPAPATE